MPIYDPLDTPNVTICYKLERKKMNGFEQSHARMWPVPRSTNSVTRDWMMQEM